MNQDPSISVVMSVFNASKYLALAVESVLSQTRPDFEFIILDDGSTDGSRMMLEDFARRDERIRLFVEKNEGLVTRLNQGVTAARGRWIARMDADDICLPKRFEAQARFLEEHPDHAAVGSGFELIDPDGDILAAGQRPLFHEEIDASHMAGRGGGIMHPAAMIRTSMLRAVGGYRKEFVVAQDVDLFLRLAEVGELANLPEPLLQYRLHPTSVSYKKTALQTALVQIALRDACARRGVAPPPAAAAPPIEPRYDPAASHHYWANLASGAGRRETALKHAWIAAWAAPFNHRHWSFLQSLLTNESSAVPPRCKDSWIARQSAVAWARLLHVGHVARSAFRRFLARSPILWRLVVAHKPEIST